MGTLRILAGNLKGRTISFPNIPGMRPAESIFRKSLFDTLTSLSLKGKFIDLFSGSGIIGFEALSRGFNKVIFIDENKELTESIKINAIKLSVVENIYVICGSLPSALRMCVFSESDVIFIDPPYQTDIIEDTIDMILSLKMMKSKTLLIIKHSRAKSIELNGMSVIKRRTFGGSVLSMMKLK